MQRFIKYKKRYVNANFFKEFQIKSDERGVCYLEASSSIPYETFIIPIYQQEGYETFSDKDKVLASKANIENIERYIINFLTFDGGRAVLKLGVKELRDLEMQIEEGGS